MNTDAIRFISKKILIKILFFHFYFLNQDFQIYHHVPNCFLCNPIDNIYLEGAVCQIFYLGPSFMQL